MDEYGSLNSTILGCKIVKETRRASCVNDSSRPIKPNSYTIIKERDQNISEKERKREYERVRGLKHGTATYGNLKRHSFIKQTHIKFNEALPYSLTNFRLSLWLSHGYRNTIPISFYLWYICIKWRGWWYVFVWKKDKTIYRSAICRKHAFNRGN